jgi:hypothetical protein
VQLPRASTRLDDLECLQGSVVAGGRQASAWGHSPWHIAGTRAPCRTCALLALATRVHGAEDFTGQSEMLVAA